jgi:hypothetical protein
MYVRGFVRYFQVIVFRYRSWRAKATVVRERATETTPFKYEPGFTKLFKFTRPVAGAKQRCSFFLVFSVFAVNNGDADVIWRHVRQPGDDDDDAAAATAATNCYQRAASSLAAVSAKIKRTAPATAEEARFG